MKRDYIFLGYQGGPEWRLIGGRNCGCEDGESAETEQIKADCAREFA